MRAIQSISGLFKKITSTNTTNHHFCLNCSHSYRIQNKFKKHELVCNNNYYCEIVLPNEKQKVTKYALGSKSLKMAYTIYVDIECILVNYKTCSNDPNKSHSNTISTHIRNGYGINVVKQHQKNYHTYYRGIYCMSKLSKVLLKIGEKISKEEKEDMIPLSEDELSKHEKAKLCHLCTQTFNTKKLFK